MSIKEILRILLFYPIYWLNYLIPKSKNIWIFGEFIGKKYSDNPSYLFEYTNQVKNNIRPIWLTQSKEVFKQIKEKGLEVYFTYSFRGFFYSSIAKIKIVSSSTSDVNRFMNSGSLIINLWHGIPLKKIGYDNKLSGLSPIKKTKLWEVLSFFIPYLKEKYSYVLATSEIVSKTMKSALKVKDNTIFISGLPRTDILKEKLKNSNPERNIFYLPTYRDKYCYNYFETLDLERLNGFLNNNNMVLYYKLHPLDNDNLKLESKRIIRLNPKEDLYSILKNTDILITDYSSVYFDFLLTLRPIIFTPFDMDTYLMEREMYYDYNDVTPGKKCINWNMVIDEMEEIILDRDAYKETRKLVSNDFNQYKDFASCERIFNWIQTL